MPTPSAELRIRDPFILPVPERGQYFLYSGDGQGFSVRSSPDLEAWSEPAPIFRPPDGFWADRDFWAPEVFRHRGRYYLLASLHAPGKRRGTQAFVADGPDGPFLPLGPHPLTPPEWDCLDGTLFVEDGQAWLIFCHEWVQTGDGEIRAVPLSDDLPAPLGPPSLLFHASAAPWVRPVSSVGHTGTVTDGPFLHRLTDGGLFLLWSSFGDGGYALGMARSRSGRLAGPWEHDPAPLYDADGGHGMLFHTFAGRLMACLHAPNTSDARLILLPVEERDGSLVQGDPQ